jgi:hypothetical protein
MYAAWEKVRENNVIAMRELVVTDVKSNID